MPQSEQSRQPQHRRRRSVGVSAAGVVLAALALGLSGCSPTVHATAAPDGASATCSALLKRLPATLEGLARRQTDASGVVAWGDPVQVLLSCGVTVPAASTLPCITIGDVDWLNDQRSALTVLTSYGRSPAVDVAIQTSSLVTPGSTAQGLAASVSTLPADGRRCQ